MRGSLVIGLAAIAASSAVAVLPPKADRGLIDKPALTTSSGERVSLADVAEGQPLAVVVIKGTWCPVCVAQLERLATDARRGAHGGLVAIDADAPAVHRAFLAREAYPFEILSDDPGDSLLQPMGFWMPKRGVPLPGVFYVDKCGDLREPMYGRRPGAPQETLIFETLRRLDRETRPCGPSS